MFLTENATSKENTAMMSEQGVVEGLADSCVSLQIFKDDVVKEIRESEPPLKSDIKIWPAERMAIFASAMQSMIDNNPFMDSGSESGMSIKVITDEAVTMFINGEERLKWEVDPNI